MKLVVAFLLGLVVASPASADLKFTKLSENQFMVHHRKRTLIGAEAKATNTAYREAASLCVAAGFTHLEVLDLNIGERTHGGPWGGGRGASADMRVKFYSDPATDLLDEKDLIECQPLADPEKIPLAKKKLAEQAPQNTPPPKEGSRRR